MSLQDKMRAVAVAAAQEAALNERARCLWCADQVIIELQAKVAKTLLLSPMHEQLARTKVKLADAIVRQIRTAIISGVRPPGGPEKPGLAPSSPLDRVKPIGDPPAAWCMECHTKIEDIQADTTCPTCKKLWEHAHGA